MDLVIHVHMVKIALAIQVVKRLVIQPPPQLRNHQHVIRPCGKFFFKGCCIYLISSCVLFQMFRLKNQKFLTQTSLGIKNYFELYILRIIQVQRAHLNHPPLVISLMDHLITCFVVMISARLQRLVHLT